MRLEPISLQGLTGDFVPLQVPYRDSKLTFLLKDSLVRTRHYALTLTLTILPHVHDD